MLRRSALISAIVLLPLLPGPSAHAAVRVAVASNFSGALKEIANRYQALTGEKIEMTSGSSGRFYAQIAQGAPFDILLSADQDVPRRLEQEGWAIQGSRFTYAVGELVLWSSVPGYVASQEEALARLRSQKVAVANPRLAPYGRAAVETTRALRLKPSWVEGENVAQAYQFVVTGNAPIGFVAYSQVLERPGGSHWKVPSSMHAPIRQDAALLARARGNAAASEFLAFLKTNEVREILRKRGYGP